MPSLTARKIGNNLTDEMLKQKSSLTRKYNKISNSKLDYKDQMIELSNLCMKKWGKVRKTFPKINNNKDFTFECASICAENLVNYYSKINIKKGDLVKISGDTCSARVLHVDGDNVEVKPIVGLQETRVKTIPRYLIQGMTKYVCK